MSSSIINPHSANLLRYGLGLFGVFYGFTRYYSLTDFVHKRHNNEKLDHEELLVDRAKRAFDNKLAQEEAVAAAKDGIVTDPDHYNFDAEKYLLWKLNRLQ